MKKGINILCTTQSATRYFVFLLLNRFRYQKSDQMQYKDNEALGWKDKEYDKSFAEDLVPSFNRATECEELQINNWICYSNLKIKKLG